MDSELTIFVRLLWGSECLCLPPFVLSSPLSLLPGRDGVLAVIPTLALALPVFTFSGYGASGCSLIYFVCRAPWRADQGDRCRMKIVNRDIYDSLEPLYYCGFCLLFIYFLSMRRILSMKEASTFVGSRIPPPYV